MHSSALGAAALMVFRSFSSAACLSALKAARYSSMVLGLPAMAPAAGCPGLVRVGFMSIRRVKAISFVRCAWAGLTPRLIYRRHAEQVVPGKLAAVADVEFAVGIGGETPRIPADLRATRLAVLTRFRLKQQQYSVLGQHKQIFPRNDRG